MKLNDKIIVVTGGAGVLCSAIARALARDGARLALIGQTESKVLAFAEELKAEGGQAIGIGGSVTSEADMQAALETIVSTWARRTSSSTAQAARIIGL